MSHTNQVNQVMWNRLLGVVEEQAQALIRAAFSPIVRECGDISAGIFDRQGQMLAQAVTGTPGHINTMAQAVKAMIDYFPIEKMNEGDIYVTNDPWLASGHLNDLLLIKPAIVNHEVVGFSSCTSHLVDLGGKGMGPQGSDIYDEGLLIPPCKLVENDQVNMLLLQIIKENSREPIANEGDIYALIACCETGVNRLIHMMDEFSILDVESLSNYILNTSAAATKKAIKNIDNGVYKNVLKLDGYEKPIQLHGELTIEDEHISLDFSGTSGCSKYGINVPINYAAAYSVFALRCLIAPEVPNNAGSLSLFTVTGPENCILNAKHPAPVAMRHTIGQMTPDLVFGCLHQAMGDQVPAEGASCMYDLPLRNTADAYLKSGKVFALELSHNGGTGATAQRDGLSATAFPSGVWGSQVEISESVAPIIINCRQLRQDSGGAGMYRGGLGQRIELSSAINEDMMVFLSVDRIENPAKGREGGHNGATGRITLSNGEKIAGKGELCLNSGDTLIFETPGGGGYGNPKNRDEKCIIADIENDVISLTSANQLYGFNDETK